jgi:hypothetical protein
MSFKGVMVREALWVLVCSIRKVLDSDTGASMTATGWPFRLNDTLKDSKVPVGPALMV